ncbi:MAG: lysophospholipase L1-like esterase [Verrucomicrobiales bacterium]|jgi:lysophospholipase L1-like esterase
MTSYLARLIGCFVFISAVHAAAQLKLVGQVDDGREEPIAFLASSAKILFLGDSITNSGQFITMLEAYFLQEHRETEGLEWINLGLSSETCTGLSEPSHPFPRPNVQERLERALDKVMPDVVVVCYGMNDGIYHPFDEGRFKAYQKGITTIVTKAKAIGAYVILLTPPPFDPLPMREQGKLVPVDGKEFAWTMISEDYDSVIERYAQWILTQKDQVDMVIDVHTPISDVLADRRKSEPHYAMSTDGVHMDEDGHRVMADAILQAWGMKPKPLDADIYQRVSQRQSLLHAAWLSHVGHKRPGIKPGLPLAEAQAKAAGMKGVIQTLAKNELQIDRFERLDKKIASLAHDIHAAQIRLGDHHTRFLFPATETPVALNSGSDLSNWDGDSNFWSVEADRTIKGANEGEVPSSTYLFTKKSYREFRLIFEVKQTMSAQHSTMHSAAAVLGERFEDKGPNPYGFKGPLLMFCHDWGIWDAYRRNRIEPAGHQGTLNVGDEEKGDWNLVEFLVIGNRIRGAANGTEIFDFTDKPEMLQASPIGLQLHSNKQPQTFQFRHLFISENPEDTLATARMKTEGVAP